jgi:heterodisulfide reductase subunit A-like polyferredoxin
MSEEKSVLVIGGGIAGIQASLDLAEQGYKVHIIEKSPSIGGKMALLDKTFPTMDCAVCIFAPKMIETSRHPNINVLSYSQVKSVSGEAGKFNIQIQRDARYIREDRCTGCNDCTEVCPVDIPSDYEMGFGTRKAIYRLFPQAVPNVFTIDKRGIPPCKATCPAGMNVQGYIALVREGKFKEAVELMRQDIPFPAVCGRVCFHPCEAQCERRLVDESIAIRDLKRFASDYELANGIEIPEITEKRDETVAIVGAGPSGLTAAYELAKNGYGVTVFESQDEPGGMLRYAIPDYRLPKDVLAKEIQFIKDLGVQIRTNKILGKDITLEGLRTQYNSVLLAIGTQKNREMNIPGEDTHGVIQALQFLNDVNSKRKIKLKGRVAVIGGGNVAIDAARCAYRMGADEVYLIYRRSREEMPAYGYDVVKAEQEGVTFHLLANPVAFNSKDGKISAVECIRMDLGELDASGRRRPVPIEGSEFTIDVNTIILAIGQMPDGESISDSLDVTRESLIVADEISLNTNLKGVFASGDIVLGPSTVIDAIAEGKRAAESIHRYLNFENLTEGRDKPIIVVKDVHIDGIAPAPRQPMLEHLPGSLLGNFDEIELGFTPEMASIEADRCLSCGGCSDCHECRKVCEPNAIDYNMVDYIEELDVSAIVVATGLETFDPSVIKEYGYGRFKNVITALEMERMLSTTGCTSGELIRLSDEKHPHNVTFLQCVGSRSMKEGYPYCSSVCCMHATKEGILVKEHIPEAEVSLFYTDMRAFGKEFRSFVNRAQEDYGLTYIRAKPAEVREDPDTGNLHFWYEDTLTGEIKKFETELIILSTALTPSKDNPELASTLGVEVDEYGFFVKPDPILSPLSTTRDGIFVCGFCQGPKDIPDAIAEASGVASMVGSFIERAEVEQ